jgi:hypothetical protein
MIVAGGELRPLLTSEAFLAVPSFSLLAAGARPQTAVVMNVSARSRVA